jgi:hypothetical protein
VFYHYTELYGPINVLGHILKVLAFIFIYYSLILNEPILESDQEPDGQFKNITQKISSNWNNIRELQIQNRKRLTDLYTDKIDKLKKKDNKM